MNKVFFFPAQLLVCAFCGIGKRDLVVFGSLVPRTILLGSCNMKLLQMKLGQLKLVPRSSHSTSESLIWWMHFHMKPSREQIISQVFLIISWVDMFPCLFLPHIKKCKQTRAELFSFPPSLTYWLPVRNHRALCSLIACSQPCSADAYFWKISPVGLW